ncbi:acid shock protein [Leminorella grimontii]|uniref:Acid shock protein n=1 Tax=Leminorella grimontii TaxID=82981 RepID=A0AAV5N4S6_9GAMM|nr:hypothetical protein [Leminorella grimontii]KFC97176.1 hypothetical protein GLGR_0714 [Leminorella grimontii ATCC 33999 = DSM 5078]GKX56980.1 acid shock protein [Leminorella grimontii]VFS57400.1 acid shock protein precursor [Leminorella grimontii]
MKKLLPLAVASLFVLSSSVFAAETATAPAAEGQQAAQHKTADKTKQHKKHAKKKAEAQKPAQQEAQQPAAK